ncbi:MAG: tRNA 2-selenouridine(34) synthase MnmH [Bacteroidales bacterium]|nr:tRNA 2-selenouridine(34) synthase MnmH [Bacteroidales bacterium]
MSQYIEADEFLEKSKSISIIDVRTPAEFEQGHISGAFNIPIFSNEERAAVGTLYKNSGKNTAVLKGLEFVGPKLVLFAKQVKTITKSNSILIHCWRGGMRSSSMAWLFETIGIDSFLLKGGYKAYRSFIRESFNESKKIIILGGLTGSGKTDVLKELEKNGEQIIDLEGLAHHKGSAFGALGQNKQPTTEQYENDLYEIWNTFDLNKRIWLEDESQSIGFVWLPISLYSQMRQAVVVKMNIPFECRIKRLVKEYSCFDNTVLEEIVNKLFKRLGGQNVKDALAGINDNNYALVAEIVLKYYDKAYNFGLNKRDESKIYDIVFTEDIPENNAKSILKEFPLLG